MFRVALIAYLSLTTILGPSLCCCNSQQLFSLVAGLKCCGKPVAPRSDAELVQVERHAHHHGFAHHRHEHSPAPASAKTDPAPVRQEHDEENCPCGKHYASMVAVVTDGVPIKAVEMRNPTGFVPDSLLPVLSESDLENVSLIGPRRHADLYGREMLRAYQIMRC